MDFKKVLLHAASILALTAGIQHSAEAAVPRDEAATRNQGEPVDIFAKSEADLLFDLMARTQGSLTSKSIEKALKDMFANPSREQVKQFPAVLAGIAALGSPDALAKASDVLVTLVLNLASIDSELRESVRAKLGAEYAPIVLAIRNKCYVGGREVPCNTPGAVPGPLGGAIGGGAGGGGGGGY